MEFTPTSSKFQNQLCQGCYIMVTDRTKLEPAQTGLTIAWTLKHLFSESYQLDSIIRLTQNDATLAALKSTQDPSKLPELWKQDLEQLQGDSGEDLIYR